jgi:hypothetical protein
LVLVDAHIAGNTNPCEAVEAHPVRLGYYSSHKVHRGVTVGAHCILHHCSLRSHQRAVLTDLDQTGIDQSDIVLKGIGQEDVDQKSDHILGLLVSVSVESRFQAFEPMMARLHAEGDTKAVLEAQDHTVSEDGECAHSCEGFPSSGCWKLGKQVVASSLS